MGGLTNYRLFYLTGNFPGYFVKKKGVQPSLYSRGGGGDLLGTVNFTAVGSAYVIHKKSHLINGFFIKVISLIKAKNKICAPVTLQLFYHRVVGVNLTVAKRSPPPPSLYRGVEPLFFLAQKSRLNSALRASRVNLP